MTTRSGHLTDAQAQLHVDGALDAAEAPEVERHLAGCAGCQILVESYRVLSGALEELEVPELPADFTASVLARVDARERAAARERRLALAILSAVVAATAAVFAIAGATAWAPTVARAAAGVSDVALAWRVGSGVVPTVVSALRLQIVLGAAALALPLLVVLARLIPVHRTEVAA